MNTTTQPQAQDSHRGNQMGMEQHRHGKNGPGTDSTTGGGTMSSPFLRRKNALVFYRWDQTGDGLLGTEDLEAWGRGVAEQLNAPEGSPQYERIVEAYRQMWQLYFKPFDRDDDDALTLEEFLENIAAFGAPGDRERGIAASGGLFDALDLDEDGRVAREEYAAFVRPLGASVQKARTAFGHLDRDGDGFITREEFAEDVLEYFQSEDPSAPGNWLLTWEDPATRDAAAAMPSGLEYLHAVNRGELPGPPFLALLGIGLSEIERGRVVCWADPGERHYSQFGAVHGGLVSSLAHSAMACAIHTLLPAGDSYTTLEVKVNFVRRLTQNVGRVFCEARVIHGGRRVATAEARVVDQAGKVYASATNTCLMLPAEAAELA